MKKRILEKLKWVKQPPNNWMIKMNYLKSYIIDGYEIN